MDRREFIKFLALTGAGVAALPEQIAAFERYYEVNTPVTSSALLAVDEIFVSGLATTSTPILLDFFPKAQSGGMKLAMNCFGGVLVWRGVGDNKIVLRRPDFTWDISAPGYDTVSGENEDGERYTIIKTLPPFRQVAVGHVSYIDQTGLRINQPITDWGVPII